MRETVELLEIPPLTAFGLPTDRADHIVAKAAKASSMQGNPIPLTPNELHTILVTAGA